MRAPAGPFTMGKTVRCRARFKNENGALADPTTVTFSYAVIDEKGNHRGPFAFTFGVDNVVVKEATGIYHYDLNTGTLGMGGRYSRRWVGTGTVAEADERDILVERSLVVPLPD